MASQLVRLVVLACVLAVACLTPAGCDGGDPARDAALTQIEGLASRARPTPEERRALVAACAAFVETHPGDESTSQVMQRQGLALASLGEDDAAAAALAASLAGTERTAGDTSPEPSSSPRRAFRLVSLHALAQAHLRRDDVAGARAALDAVQREAPEGSDAAKAARADLRDLARLGEPAASGLWPSGVPAGVPALPSGSAFALAFVRRGDPAPDLRAQSLTSHVVLVEVVGWEDPRIAGVRLPALPRSYVVGADGRIQAIGVRGAGLARALARAARAPAGPKDHGDRERDAPSEAHMPGVGEAPAAPGSPHADPRGRPP